MSQPPLENTEEVSWICTQKRWEYHNGEEVGSYAKYLFSVFNLLYFEGSWLLLVQESRESKKCACCQTSGDSSCFFSGHSLFSNNLSCKYFYSVSVQFCICWGIVTFAFDLQIPTVCFLLQFFHLLTCKLLGAGSLHVYCGYLNSRSEECLYTLMLKLTLHAET